MDNRHLFRGKRLFGILPGSVEKWEWVRGYLNGETQIRWFHSDGHHYADYEVDPSTIGQCSGILATKSYRGESKADRLIFEGDIVRHENLDPLQIFRIVPNEEEFIHSTVVFDKKNAMFNLDRENQYNVFCLSVYKDIEIIGTIHDWTEGKGENEKVLF